MIGSGQEEEDDDWSESPGHGNKTQRKIRDQEVLGRSDVVRTGVMQ